MILPESRILPEDPLPQRIFSGFCCLNLYTMNVLIGKQEPAKATSCPQVIWQFIPWRQTYLPRPFHVRPEDMTSTMITFAVQLDQPAKESEGLTVNRLSRTVRKSYQPPTRCETCNQFTNFSIRFFFFCSFVTYTRGCSQRLRRGTSGNKGRSRERVRNNYSRRGKEVVIWLPLHK